MLTLYLIISFAVEVVGLEAMPHLQFIRWPHRCVFDGYLNDGTWVTNDNDGILNAMLYQSSKSPDIIQNSSLSEGIFLVQSNHSNSNNFHLFSAKEAQTCLWKRSVLIAGDSYMKQLYIGLADILLGDPSNNEIHGGAQRGVVAELIRKRLSSTFGSNMDIRFIFSSCYLKDLSCFKVAIKSNKSFLKKADALVINCLIHHAEVHKHENETMGINYMQQLRNLFHDMISDRIPVTWATGPSYENSKVPLKYVNSTKHRSTIELNALTMTLAKEYNIPLLDFYTITGKCWWNNCTADGGHRSRFVNRMKAQMLLNNLCSIK